MIDARLGLCLSKIKAAGIVTSPLLRDIFSDRCWVEIAESTRERKFQAARLAHFYLTTVSLGQQPTIENLAWGKSTIYFPNHSWMLLIHSDSMILSVKYLGVPPIRAN